MGHCYNVNPAVVKTVVSKLSSCVKSELTGLDWGTENTTDMLNFLLAKVETGVKARLHLPELQQRIDALDYC